MEIKKLMGEECKRVRPLWEEVFFEDSKLFTDYYFENKAKENIGYVMGQYPYEAMMFRTPYTLQIGTQRKEISYLVGVATREECRHRGYMRNLLLHSFQELYKEKQPFIFLMPANPAIYEPFGFRYIYEQDVWRVKEERQETYLVSELCENCPGVSIMDRLAEFANTVLKEHYQIYVHRDGAYYERMLKELKAQNGDICVKFEQQELVAYYLYAKEDNKVFVQEVLEKEEGKLRCLEKTGEKKPVIMARIIHLEEMMKLVRSQEVKNIILRVEDEFLVKNSAVYEWKITPHGSEVRKLKDSDRAEISMHISELAPRILTKVFLNEIV